LHISANIQNLLRNFLAPCPHIIHTKFLFKIRLLKLTDKKQFKKKLTDDRQTDRDTAHPVSTSALFLVIVKLHNRYTKFEIYTVNTVTYSFLETHFY